MILLGSLVLIKTGFAVGAVILKTSRSCWWRVVAYLDQYLQAIARYMIVEFARGVRPYASHNQYKGINAHSAHTQEKSVEQRARLNGYEPEVEKFIN
jgi:hypothetical protein